VEQNQWRAAAACQQPHAQSGVGEVQKGLLNLGSYALEEIGFGLADTFLESNHPVYFSFTRH
jgi:hypothetical protein